MTHPANGHDPDAVGTQANQTPEPPRTTPETRVVVLIPTTDRPCKGLMRWIEWQRPLYPLVTVQAVIHQMPGYVEDIRQCLVDGFLGAATAPWLLMVDDDTTPRLSALQIAEGAEQAGALMTASPVPFHPLLLDEQSPRGVHANIFEVDATGYGRAIPWHKLPWPESGGARFWPIESAGFGCTLLHRTVLQRLVNAARKGTMEWPMRAVWRNGRCLRSEDIAFWRRAARLGFKFYADLANPCIHDKRFALTPEMAIHDQPFWRPGEPVHPNAPHSIVVPVQPESAAAAEGV